MKNQRAEEISDYVFKKIVSALQGALPLNDPAVDGKTIYDYMDEYIELTKLNVGSFSPEGAKPPKRTKKLEVVNG